MKRGSRESWHLVGALLVAAVGCNLVLGNEKGRLAPAGEGGGDAEAGMGTFGGKAGSGGKRGGGGAPSAGSAGEAGEAGNTAAGKGGSGGTTEPGDGGEPSDGGSTPARGGASSAGGKANGGAGGAAPPAGGGKTNGGTMGQGGSPVPPPMGGAQSCDPDTAPTSCVNTSTVRYCDDTSSTWITRTCTSACTELGFTSGTCPDDSGCECAGPKYLDCHAGAESYCACAGCSIVDFLTIYRWCFEQTAPYAETTLCWAEAPSCDDGILVCGGYEDGGS